MNITYLVGDGPNGAKVPLMAFLAREDAESYLVKLGFVNRGRDWFREIVIDGKSMDIDVALDEDGNDWLRQALFYGGSYYGGCGELGSIVLITAPIGTPIVGWSFD